jgi:hypothetical protein
MSMVLYLIVTAMMHSSLVKEITKAIIANKINDTVLE